MKECHPRFENRKAPAIVIRPSGLGAREIVEIHGVSERTVSAYTIAYMSKGIADLKSKKRNACNPNHIASKKQIPEIMQSCLGYCVPLSLSCTKESESVHTGIDQAVSLLLRRITS